MEDLGIHVKREQVEAVKGRSLNVYVRLNDYVCMCM